MTVRQLFESSDFSKVTEHMAENERIVKYDNTKTKEEKEELKKELQEHYLEGYREMMSLEVKPNPENIICAVYIQDRYDEEEEDSFIDVSLVNKEDLLKKKIYQEEEHSKEKEEDPQDYVETYAFEFTDWEEVLGSDVSQASVELYGKEAVAEAVFNEMTFFGVSREAFLKNREEMFKDLDESIAEIEEHPENLKDAKDVFKELEEEGLLPEISEEEKEKREKRTEEDAKVNTKEYAKVLSMTRKEIKEGKNKKKEQEEER